MKMKMNNHFPLAAPISFSNDYPEQVSQVASSIVRSNLTTFAHEFMILQMFISDIDLDENETVDWEDACHNDRYVIPYFITVRKI